MRIVEKLLYGVCGIIGLMLLFILLCHLNPNIAKGFAKTSNAAENVGTEGNVIQQTATLENASDKIELQKIESNVLGTSTYEAPSESALEIPTAVLNLMSMEVPTGKATDVSDDELEALKLELSVGNTGEDLTYDQIYYPYFYMLDDNGKALYKQMNANAKDLMESFAPVVEDATATQLQNAFVALVNDHPELFWMNTAYGYKVDSKKNVVEIDLSYNFTTTDFEGHQKSMEDALNSIVYGSRGVGTKYDEEVYVHDELCKLITYDLNAPANQTAYSALVTERTVCAGYARAFQYIMQQLEIPCYYCAGYSGENHAWDIIKLDADYYNVDVTWDDQENTIIYDFFNCSDAEYGTTHIRRDLSVNLPACLGGQYSSLENAKELEDETEDASSTTTSKETTTSDTQSAETTTATTTNTNETTAEETTTTTTQDVTTTTYINKKTDYPIYESLDEYNVECAHRLTENTGNTVSYTLYVEDEDLWDEIKDEYSEGTYGSAYLDRILAERHANGATVSVTGQIMDDETVKIKHSYQFY